MTIATAAPIIRDTRRRYTKNRKDIVTAFCICLISYCVGWQPDASVTDQVITVFGLMLAVNEGVYQYFGNKDLKTIANVANVANATVAASNRPPQPDDLPLGKATLP